MILAAGEKPKMSAPNVVSIMFTDDDGESKIQVACNLAECPGLENPVDGPDLNVVMGSTILQGKTDIRKEHLTEIRSSIRDVRYDF